MTNEEWQRRADFIVEQQAQFASDIQRLKELHSQAEVRITSIEDVVLRLANATENRISTLADATESRISTLTEKMTELAESQLRTDSRLAETDERLNSLITIVERYISERRNGKS